MKTRATLILFALIVLSACSQAASPTRPSPLTALPDAGSSQRLSTWAASAGPAQVVEWACVTQGVGCPARVPLGLTVAEDAPGAPANLAFQVSGNTVILTWSPPGGGGAVVTYVLEAGFSAGSSNLARFETGSTSTTMTVTNVPNGTYFVRVRARNADGTSGPSNEVSITVGSGGGPCSPPSAPSGFAATASGNTVTLTWNTVAGAISFIIEAGSAPGAADIVAFETGNTATSFSGTAPNGTYYLRVRVRTACGTSAASNEAVLTVSGSGPPPGPNVTGRWLGLVANGEGATSTPNECGVEKADLQLDLIQNGTSLTSTITFTIQVSTCDPPGSRRSTSATGSISGNNITLVGFPDLRHRIDVTGTIAGTRMTGRLLSNGGQDGDSTFVINKQ